MSKRVNLKAVNFNGEKGGLAGKKTGIRVEDSDSLSFTDNTSDKPFSVSFWARIANKDATDAGGAVCGRIEFDGEPDLGPGAPVTQRANEWFVRFEPVVAQSGGVIGLYLYDPDTAAGGNSGAQLRAFTNDTTLIQSNTWHHVVCTYSGDPDFGADNTNSTLVSSGISVYFDGQIVPSTEQRRGKYAHMLNRAGVFSIGCFGEVVDSQPDNEDPIDDLRVFKGKLADICVFNKELSASEVAEIYNSGKVKDMTKHSAYNNIVSWWKMGDDQDHTGTDGIKDYVGINHGTMKFLENTTIVTDPSLPTDRERSEIFTHSSFGNTRQPKNLAGDHQVYIHGGQSGNMPKTDPSGVADGYPSENQRYLHTYWKTEQTNKTHQIVVFGYSYAMGTWSLLHDVGGNQIKLDTANAAVDQYKIFEISGVDRLYFKSTGTHDLLSTDLFAAAASSM